MNKIKDIANVVAGQSPQSEFYSTTEGIPFMQGNRTFGTKYPTIDLYTTKVTKMAAKGDVLMSVRAPVGDLNISNCDLCIGRGLVALKALNGDNEFLYYALKYNIKNLIRQGGGTTFDSIGKDVINEFELVIPKDETYRKKVSKLLQDIDSKIELNNKINTELEEMAKTIYDYWFVQFDFPNDEGKTYKSSGGKMVWNEKLKIEIPEGWHYKDLGSIEPDIITGKTPSTKISTYYNGDIPFITIPDIRGNTYITETLTTLSKDGADSQNNKYLPEDALCVSCIATIGLMGFTTRLSQTNQQINSIVFKEDYNKFYIYNALKDYFNRATTAKTGNAFANMNKGDFTDIRLIYPTINILIKYNQLIKSSFATIKNNQKESQELTSLREFLLSLLMNGQVGFNE